MGWYVLRVHIWYTLSGKDWASNRLRHARGHDTNCEMLCLAGCEDAESCKYKDADSCKYKDADFCKKKKPTLANTNTLLCKYRHKYGHITIQLNPTKNQLQGSQVKLFQSLSSLNEVGVKFAQSVNDHIHSLSVQLVHTKLSPAIRKCISQSSIIEAIFIVRHCFPLVCKKVFVVTSSLKEGGLHLSQTKCIFSHKVHIR